MPYLLSEFLRKHTGVDLVMDVTNKASVLESLDKNTADFTMMSLLPEMRQIDYLALMPNQLFLVANPKLITDQSIKEEAAIEHLPLIFREKGSATRGVMEDFLATNNISAQKKIELTSNEAVKQAVIAGLGCSIMPLIGIRNELEKGDLQILPMEGLPITTTWNLVWLRDKKFSPAARAYLEYIHEEKDRLIQKEFASFFK